MSPVAGRTGRTGRRLAWAAAAAVPVAFGVATGDRPHAVAWAGIVLGAGAVVLVSRGSGAAPLGTRSARVAPRTLALACLAGVGFGAYFIFLARAGAGSGLWPLSTVSIRPSCHLTVTEPSWFPKYAAFAMWQKSPT